jgi:hypothetical protein
MYHHQLELFARQHYKIGVVVGQHAQFDVVAGHLQLQLVAEHFQIELTGHFQFEGTKHFQFEVAGRFQFEVVAHFQTIGCWTSSSDNAFVASSLLLVGSSAVGFSWVNFSSIELILRSSSLEKKVKSLAKNVLNKTMNVILPSNKSFLFLFLNILYVLFSTNIACLRHNCHKTRNLQRILHTPSLPNYSSVG